MTESRTESDALLPFRRADPPSREEELLHNALWPGPQPGMTPPGRPAARARLRYACLPSRAEPRFMLPVTPGPVSAAAIRALPPLRRLPPWSRTAAGALGRLGVLRLWPHQALVVQPASGQSLVRHLGMKLGAPVTAAARLGPPRANRKPVLELFDKTGQTRAFAKVGWNDLTAQLVRQEGSALKVVRARGLAHLETPRLIDEGACGGVDYLLLAPVDSDPREQQDRDTRDRAMVALTNAFAEPAASLGGSPYWTTLRSSLDDLTGPGERLASAARRLHAVADQITIIPSAWHGDWTPWNMTTRRGTATVWDWERFELGVPAGYDAVHYAFHHAVRRDGFTPQTAIRKTTAGAAGMLSQFGVAPSDARAIVALYLLHLGQRHVHDRQEEAGAKKGPLVTWLVPEVEALVSWIIDTSGGELQDRPT